MSADDRRARFKRIRALLDKTVARGCTEAETVAAAALAARLMAEHGIDAAEIGAGEEKMFVAAAPFWHAVLVRAACRCTNTVPVRSADEGTLSFIGREPGPTIAAYLRDLSIRPVVHARPGFIRSHAYFRHRLNLHRDRAERDFLTACSERLAERLVAVFPPPGAAARTQAVALGDRLYPATVPIAAGWLSRGVDAVAASAGLAAADAVGLHRAVAGARTSTSSIGVSG